LALHSQNFAIITRRLNVKCWKKWNIPTKFEKNRTKLGNRYYFVLFENRTKPGTVLIETVLCEIVLSRDSLYIDFCLSTSGLEISLHFWQSWPTVRWHIVICMCIEDVEAMECLFVLLSPHYSVPPHYAAPLHRRITLKFNVCTM
jgi:hypothetical protein